MRINARISPENRLSLNLLINAVNAKRHEMGLDFIGQADIVNDLIARAAEQSTINLCGVFLFKEKVGNYDAYR